MRLLHDPASARRAVATGLVVGIGVFAAAGLFARTRATPTGTASTIGDAVISPGTLSVLTKANTSGYAPSTRTLELQSGRLILSDARSLRFARAVGTVRLFVAPGSSSNEVCLIVEDAKESSTSVDCAPRSLLTTGAVYLTKPDEATRTVDLFALVRDGVKSVAAASVENNVAVVRNLRDQVIPLTNQVGRLSMVDLGPQFS